VTKSETRDHDGFRRRARDPFYIHVLRYIVKENDLTRVHKGSGAFAVLLGGRGSGTVVSMRVADVQYNPIHHSLTSPKEGTS